METRAFCATHNRKDAPVRISEAWGNMRETSGGGTFAELVIQTFFGFDPDKYGKQVVADPNLERPFSGELRNVNYRNGGMILQAGEGGILIK